jgi:hypothetical protein
VKREAAIACVVAACIVLAGTPAQANEWRLETIPTVGPVQAIQTVAGEPLIFIGNGWFRTVVGTTRVTLGAAAGPIQRPRPPDALPDGRIAEGPGAIARAWFAEPTDRYGHGVLGDMIEAGSLVVERRDGRRDTVRLDADAVFEDLEPRIADLDGAGGGSGGNNGKIVVVKSYRDRGSALAVIGEREGRFEILSETPPIGKKHRWLNPAGVADFDGDGHVDIALVQMPHALGRLELWRWRSGALEKMLELPDTSNHVSGSRVLRMSAVADFDGDGRADIAIPSFDRRDIRVIAFAPGVRDLARVRLPARATTELAVLKDETGAPAALVGLENGALVMLRRIAGRR